MQQQSNLKRVLNALISVVDVILGIAFIGFLIYLSIVGVQGQTVECGFDALPRHAIPMKPNRVADDGQLLVIPMVVHVVHRSVDTVPGMGTNISDEQVQSAINNANYWMEHNPGADPFVRICLAAQDPQGNPTTGIVRHTKGATYDASGVSINGGPGISDFMLKHDIEWPRNNYYNVYVVSEIDGNNGGAGIQGYAYFPHNSPLDATVVLYNAIGTVGNLKSYTNQNKTFIHEGVIGHAMGLHHVFEGTYSCNPEVDCQTQGDLVCDTAPMPNYSCTSDQTCPDAPTDNYMAYGSQNCRERYTPGQIERARNIILNSTSRAPLLNSNVCTPVFSSECPGDVCPTATPIGCTPVDFDNYSCTTQMNCVLQHPAVPTVCCGGTGQYLSQWFTFDVAAQGYYTLNLGGNFSTGQNQIGNYGQLEGVEWKLATGNNCNQLEWIAASMCPTWPATCFCGPPGAGAYTAPCPIAACPDADQLIPWWHNTTNYPTFTQPVGNWLPYDPTQQLWSMIFYLPPGTYYVLVTAFTFYDPGTQNLYPSYGSGQISICPPSPLNTPPKLQHQGTKLFWSGETTTTFKVYQLEVLSSQWVQIGETPGHTWPLTSGGYYRVANSHGNSNAVHVPPIVKLNGGVIYNILGQQHAKFGILKTK